MTLANILHFPNILVCENAHGLQGSTDAESLSTAMQGFVITHTYCIV